MIDAFKVLKKLRTAERKAFGQPCPVCREQRPKAQPKVLLPGQVCRAHKPHYRDERPDITQEQFAALEIE